MGGYRYARDIFDILEVGSDIYNDIRWGIHHDLELIALSKRIMAGKAPCAWPTREGLIFFDACIYLPGLSGKLHRLLMELMSFLEEALLRYVAVDCTYCLRY